MQYVSCPTCGKRIPWTGDNRWRPFCSERCRLIDLGAWFGEDYRLPSEGPDEGDPQPDDDRHLD